MLESLKDGVSISCDVMVIGAAGELWQWRSRRVVVLEVVVQVGCGMLVVVVR